MFEKLFLLVKSNAGKAVIENPAIAEKDHEAVLIEASSSIIDVLKNHMESGKIKDLIKFFKYSGVYSTALISNIVNRYSNRLNKFYGIDPDAAYKAAAILIPAVMQQLAQQTNSNEAKEFAIVDMLTKLNGNRADLRVLVNNLMVA